MTLNPQPNYPNSRSYVVKVHRDARAAGGEIAGRLENMASGHSFEFSTGEQLLACIAQDLSPTTREGGIK
ncbi:MAG TPA: hypothetical protein VHB46_14610 [Burkholderiales bacterium]|nr:hypothetical protein [Burkholderiales bacterium]